MDKRFYHHRIVATICNWELNNISPKHIEWYSSDIITHKVVYWALRNACALTKYEMSNFKINRTSIIFIQ